MHVGEPAGEWLFLRDGKLFGPVPARILIERLEKGELGPETPVAAEGGAFRPLREVPGFVAAVAHLEAHRRVRGELSAARRTERRRVAGRGLLFGGVAAAVAAVAVAGVLVYDRFRTVVPADAGVQISAPLVAAAGTRDRTPSDDGQLLDYVEGEPRLRTSRPTSSPTAPIGGPPPANVRADPDADGLAVHHGYDEAAMDRVIKANQIGLATCVKQQANGDPALRGEVPLTFTVDNDGKVGRLWVEKPGYATGPLRDCLQASLAEWRFPAFEGERPSISLSLRIGE